ncbi:MAG: thiol reductant ABC exporter subunit CydD [Actinomycetota bacterium]|jgi:thiol reductant ABC exporter CydD subunit|nr:thiol reductant ABC exporter subunit CydD [Actinomycetota bacterium]
MSTPVAERRSSGPFDRRLTARVTATRRYLVAAVAVGLVATASIVVQAVLLADVISRALLHSGAAGASGHRATVASLTPLLVGVAVAFAVRAACGWVGEAAAARTSAEVTSVLRRQLVRHTLALGPAWLTGERAGELSLSATRGTSALETYFGRYLPQAILAGLAPLGILAWVAWTDWISFLVLAGLVALVPIAMVWFGREASRQTRRQWRKLSSLSARFLELVQGLATLRAFGRAAHGRREVAEASEGLRVTTMKTLRVAFLSALAMEFLAGIGTGLVAMILGLRLLDGSIPLSTALAVLLVSPEVFLPLRRAGAEFHASAEGQAAAQRILDVLDVPADTPPAHVAGAPATGPLDPATQPVCMQAVSVTFPGRSEPALRHFDLVVEPGEHVALVGPSGAGKSTVLGVLMGFVRPDVGSVHVGGVDLRAVACSSWRRHVAWVPQRPYLFTGTLADNLRLGAPGATDAQLGWACEQCGLAELVAELPMGLATPVGESGLSVSAGERQRVALARAIVRDVPVVLLDEPVAHLDSLTEELLRSNLAPWFEGRSVVVAAHRPELVARIDRTVLIDAGHASAVGVQA